MKINVSVEVRAMMPEFFNRVEKGEIFAYDGGGFTRDLSDEMKAKIKSLKDEYNIEGIVAVIDTTLKLGGGDDVDYCHMSAYVFMDDEDYNEPWAINDSDVGFMAYVVNDSWDIEDQGSIGLKERIGCVFRSH